MTDEEKIKFWDRYDSAMHAVQSGIAWEISLDNGGVDVNSDPNLKAHKHLRVGIDGSKSDFGALAQLLIAKGVFTEEEYLKAILAGAEEEQRLYEAIISERLGREIHLA